MVALASIFRGSDRLSLLISDQDEAARESLKRCLGANRWEFHEAGSGREAMHIIREHVVHVLVSAVELPDTTGFDVAHGLRRLDRWVPFILTVSELNKEVLLRALLAKAFTVIQKPIDEWVFRSTVDHLVGRWYEGNVPRGWERDRRSWRRSAREDELL